MPFYSANDRRNRRCPFVICIPSGDFSSRHFACKTIVLISLSFPLRYAALHCAQIFLSGWVSFNKENSRKRAIEIDGRLKNTRGDSVSFINSCALRRAVFTPIARKKIRCVSGGRVVLSRGDFLFFRKIYIATRFTAERGNKKAAVRNSNGINGDRLRCSDWVFTSRTKSF